MPTERVEHRLPASVQEFGGLDEEQLERLVQFGREGSLATDRETGDRVLLVSVADDVDQVPVWARTKN